MSKQGDPEEFLPAMLEQSPASASGYLTVADYYFDSGDTARAIADYEHALELAPGRADVHDSLAMAYYKQGARAEAIAQWKQVFSTLAQQVNSQRVPESFWTDFSRTCEHLRSRKVFNDLKPDVDALLRAYLHRNGNYRSNALLHSAYLALSDPAAATNWLLDLASAADDPTTVLADVVEASWIPLAQRAPIYQRILQARQDAVSKAEGLQKESAQQILRSWQVRWIKYLVVTKQYTMAGDVIATLSPEKRASRKRRPSFLWNCRWQRKQETLDSRSRAIAPIRRHHPLRKSCASRRGSCLTPETNSQRAKYWSLFLRARSKSTSSTLQIFSAWPKFVLPLATRPVQSSCCGAWS